MTGILDNLKWGSLKKRRRDSRLILLYKGLNGDASIPTDNLIPPPLPRPLPVPARPPPIRRSRNLRLLTFQTRTDIYKGPFFPQTIKDWNALPDIRSSPLLKEQRMVWLGLPLWWELGTNFPYHRPWWRTTIKNLILILRGLKYIVEKYRDAEIHFAFFLAHLSQRFKVSYCDHLPSVVVVVVVGVVIVRLSVHNL